ncbi:MAG: ABC transporter permease [Opitutaceae bacterium]|nr:ABC transporter permease [Opitutaceae bacterium]
MIAIFQRFVCRLRAVFNKPALDADFSEELAQHLEAAIADNIRAGMTPDEARRKAHIGLGGVEQIRELHREARGLPSLENLARDIRFSMRMLCKSPGVTVVAVATLALGIGMNTAMFSMLNGLLLRPLSFSQVGELFRLDRNTPDESRGNHAADNFFDIRAASVDVAEIAGLMSWGMSLDPVDGAPEIVPVARVTANFFDVLRVAPLYGRTFRAEEEVLRQNDVIAISHEYWLKRFGGRKDAVGSMVRLDKRSVEIVAVMPPLADVNRIATGQNFPEPFAIYTPVGFFEYERNMRDGGSVQIFGRLLPGVGLGQAQARFNTIAADLARRFPDGNRDAVEAVRTLQSTVLRGSDRTITFLLIGLSGFVLLIACANLANLLLARSMARAREFSICAALGASRAQLIRPIVAECLLLTGTGMAASLFVVFGTSRWLAHRFGNPSVAVDFSPDARVLAFACATALVTALLFALAPAWWVSRRSPTDALKSDSRSMTGDRSQRGIREWLIVGQFALALLLLAGAGVFIRGIERLRHHDLGWQPEPLVTATLNMQDERVGWGPARAQFHAGLREKLLAIAGVDNAAVSNHSPTLYSNTKHEFRLWNGDPRDTGGDSFMAYQSVVSPSYFDTVGIRLLRGRNFNEHDHTRSRWVALIGETMAGQMFPGQDPIGQRIGYFAGAGNWVWLEIVGLVADTRPIEARPSDIRYEVYQPYAQRTWEVMTLLVRAKTPELAPALVEPIRRTVTDFNPNLAMYRVLPMATLIEEQTQVWETINQLLLLFAGLGLSLAGLGVYAVVARTIAQRTGEFGIRMALGAQARDILGLVFGANLRTALLGAGVGVIGALVLARYLASALPVFAEGNGPVLVAAVGVLLLVALVACLLPARRATRIDPVEALRTE